MTDDQEYVARCLSGEPEAFHELIERFEKRVYGLARRYLGNRDDAMEVAQETFARAFEKLGTYDPSRRFSTWIVSIAANLSRDILRKRSRRGEVLDDERVGREAGGESPSRAASEKEQAERLREAVASLPEEKRLAVELRYFQGLSLAEIAEVTGTEPSTLKVRLFRARRDLEQLLGGW